ncbi:MAG: patatin-like phospholipase family protein, partial [Christensenellaceae bacterium]|nr:patatin-like phospholipase family protein [Christensenellaceae bacterium]
VADVRGLIGELRQTGLHKGVDTTRMKAKIGELIDEARLRASGKVYGLVTVSVTEFKPYQLLLQDIPEGALLDYVMASASFPGFQPQVIGEHTFLDGGLFNNCPINLLTDLGFDEVIAIRTGGPGLFFPPKTDAKITIISPSRDLGNVMSFDNEQALRNLSVGYLDALKMLRALKGRSYYVEPWQGPDAVQRFLKLPDSLIADMRGAFMLPDLPPKRLLFERILPELGTHLKLEHNYGYEDLMLALIEAAAADAGVDPLRVFSLSALSKAILDAGEQAPGKEGPLAILSHLLDRRQPFIRQLGRFLAQSVLG